MMASLNSVNNGSIPSGRLTFLFCLASGVSRKYHLLTCCDGSVSLPSCLSGLDLSCLTDIAVRGFSWPVLSDWFDVKVHDLFWPDLSDWFDVTAHDFLDLSCLTGLTSGFTTSLNLT